MLSLCVLLEARFPLADNNWKNLFWNSSNVNVAKRSNSKNSFVWSISGLRAEFRDFEVGRDLSWAVGMADLGISEEKHDGGTDGRYLFPTTIYFRCARTPMFCADTNVLKNDILSFKICIRKSVYPFLTFFLIRWKAMHCHFFSLFVFSFFLAGLYPLRTASINWALSGHYSTFK